MDEMSKEIKHSLLAFLPVLQHATCKQSASTEVSVNIELHQVFHAQSLCLAEARYGSVLWDKIAKLDLVESAVALSSQIE